MATAKELLFEIGTEEIPSVYMPDALRDLGGVTERVLREARLGVQRTRAPGPPRRLPRCVEDLADKQTDEVREVIGPPKGVAFDKAGRPTAAALGFARAQGIAMEKLKIKVPDRGEYVVAVRRGS